jgi:glycosyltransferase involved in cell wall biosynthesis
MALEKKRIGLDVSNLIISKQVTGIERVCIEINKGITKLFDSKDYEIEPFVTIPEFKKPVDVHPHLASDPIFNKPLASINTFDVLFFGSINISLPVPDILRLKREKGVKVVTLVHDILPITHPEWFPVPEMSTGRQVALSSRNAFQIYLQASFALSDRLILTSQHVFNEIMNYKWNKIPKLSIIPLGAFEIPSKKKKISHQGLRTIYLSSVTIRKGHAELLSAFDLLWEQGIDISLTIVGNKGWLIDDFIERLQSNPQKGLKLFWKERLLDSEITELYKITDIAFVTSEDEGFGLVLEEGIANGLKVIARDIPVFRERDYPNLYFYSGGPKGLSEKILEVARLPFEENVGTTVRSIQDFNLELAEVIKSV